MQRMETSLERNKKTMSDHNEVKAISDNSFIEKKISILHASLINRGINPNGH